MIKKSYNKKTRLRESSAERFARLAVLGEQVFHSGDLANLWNIRNTSTLHTTLARYVAQGLLFRVQKGLYSIKKLSDIDPRVLGIKAIHGSAYISCETVIFEAGVINQPSRFITLVSQRSRRFRLAGHAYWSRQLADAFLFHDAGVNIKNGVRIASYPRAVADMLYFNAKKHFDAPTIIDWKDVKKVASEVGYPLSIFRYYGNTK
jgi:predicted transcriptional regulator of viral defense system